MGSDPSRETGFIVTVGIPLREKGQTPFSPLPLVPGFDAALSEFFGEIGSGRLRVESLF